MDTLSTAIKLKIETMEPVENDDTRYSIEIDIETLKITRCSFDQKENLDKGRQNRPKVHRLFLTKGQYRKFIQRCECDLKSVLDTGAPLEK